MRHQFNHKMHVVNMQFHFPALGRKISGFLNAFLLILVLVAALYLLPQTGESISGQARVSDGDSLRLGEIRLRILGIDAPELDQTCLTQSGDSWPCGRVSRDFLVQILAAHPVECIWDERDKYGRALAICRADGRDIGKMMIEAGMAISYSDYAVAEALARSRKVGLWAGDFLTPRQWRDGHRGRKQPSDIWVDLWAWVTGWFA